MKKLFAVTMLLFASVMFAQSIIKVNVNYGGMYDTDNNLISVLNINEDIYIAGTIFTIGDDYYIIYDYERNKDCMLMYGREKDTHKKGNLYICYERFAGIFTDVKNDVYFAFKINDVESIED